MANGIIENAHVICGSKVDLIDFANGKSPNTNVVIYGYAIDTAEQGIWQNGSWTWGTAPLSVAAIQSIISISNVPVIRNETGTYNIQVGDDIIRCVGSFTVNLPAAVGSGAMYMVKNLSSGTIVVDGNGSEPLDADLTRSLIQWEDVLVLDAASGRWDVL